ncbi:MULTISPECIES: xylulokinase [Brucella]|uniref:FGGY family of carbohydrate kinase, N-terminal domain protein n=1 Tax=Brucella lupini TaxID=255457 RepID=A0A256GHM3_9HYPH|nr:MULTISPECIES: FGGY-family carbohydrate kinase [Brucella]KAB2702871.1 pentose kinase [Brucella lupini]KAB2728010.1 pentose kinase [Brucella anthropi]KAB2745182.1 pentose kinase [Brucella anthropi]KAB2800016.1 pentose kinase [Brucella anthropi]KAB2805607.1 pentose kinase [Brucella anthropi]
MNDLVLACDLGTGGLKGAIFAADGTLLAETFQRYPTYYPEPLLHEQRPAEWWDNLVRAVHDLLAQGVCGGFAASDIKAISLSGHSLGCIPLDAGGRLLQEAVPLWSDARAQDMARRFFQIFDEDAWYLRTGNGFPAPLYPLFKIMWLRENRPDIFARTRQILGTKDYLNHRLTGQIATDPSYASGSGCYDLTGGHYAADILAAARLSVELLPPVVPSASIVGTLLPDIANTLGLLPATAVIAGGVDNSCMALGAQTFEDGDLFSSMGSSSWLTISASRPVLDTRVRSYAFAHLVPGQFISATSIFSSGTTMDWVRNRLLDKDASHADMEACAASAPPGARGLLLVPTLGGGTSLEGGAEVRGAYIGLSLEHGRSELARAAYEGVAYGLRVALDELRGMTAIGKSMVTVGGGAKSAFWRQIFADILDIDVVKTSIDQEAATLGAAAIAFKALGLWADFTPLRSIHQIEAISRPSPQTHATYTNGLSGYRLAAEQQHILSGPLQAYRQAANH